MSSSSTGQQLCTQEVSWNWNKHIYKHRCQGFDGWVMPGCPLWEVPLQPDAGPTPCCGASSHWAGTLVSLPAVGLPFTAFHGVIFIPVFLRYEYWIAMFAEIQAWSLYNLLMSWLYRLVYLTISGCKKSQAVFHCLCVCVCIDNDGQKNNKGKHMLCTGILSVAYYGKMVPWWTYCSGDEL